MAFLSSIPGIMSWRSESSVNSSPTLLSPYETDSSLSELSISDRSSIGSADISLVDFCFDSDYEAFVA